MRFDRQPHDVELRRGGRQVRRLQRLVVPDVCVAGVRPRRGRAGGPGERLTLPSAVRSSGPVTVRSARRPGLAADCVRGLRRERICLGRRPTPPRPERRSGDDRADDGAEREAAEELGGRLLVGHVRRSVGPSTATTFTIAMPSQAPADAAMSRKSPIEASVMPNRSPSVFPAQAPRMAAPTTSGRRPPALPRIST